jgi:aminopeptidase N
MVREQTPLERDVALLDSTLDHAVGALRRYLPESIRAQQSHALVATALGALRSGSADDDRRLWLRLAIAAAASPEDLALLLDIADGSMPGDDLPIDQEMRWQLAVRQAALGITGAGERVATEAARDRSDRGQRERIRASVAAPDPGVKAEAWRRIHAEGYGSDYLTRAALSGFQWHDQRDLLVPFREPFFREVRQVYRDRDLGYARSYLGALFPSAWAEPEVLERARQLLLDLGPDEVQLRRHLLEMCDDMERTIRVRAFAASVTT